MFCCSSPKHGMFCDVFCKFNVEISLLSYRMFIFIFFFFPRKPNKVRVKTISGCLFGIGSLYEMVDKSMKDHRCTHIISAFDFPYFFALKEH